MYSEQLLTSFVRHVTAISNQYYAEHFPNNFRPVVKIEEGPKNVRIVKGTSVYGFVRKEDGVILRAASYRTPTKIQVGTLDSYLDRVLGANAVAYVGGHYSSRPSKYPPRTPETLPAFFGWTGVPSFTDFPILLDWLEENGRMDELKQVKDLYNL